MCEWGTEVTLRVLVPARLSHTGEDRFAFKGIDACIAPMVKALNDAGITTTQSCCGHGKGDGRIDLSDGRLLFVRPCDAAESPMQRCAAAVAAANLDEFWITWSFWFLDFSPSIRTNGTASELGTIEGWRATLQRGASLDDIEETWNYHAETLEAAASALLANLPERLAEVRNRHAE